MFDESGKMLGESNFTLGMRPASGSPFMRKISLLGTGLIGMFYTQVLQGQRSRDRVLNVYSRSPERAQQFAAQWGIPRHSTNLHDTIHDPETDVVVVGLPNHLHEEAVVEAAKAGKAVLCTKPLARTAPEALRMLQAVERAGVFAGYLEDLVYTPKTLKALERGAWQSEYKRAKAELEAIDPKKREQKALMDVAALTAQEATSPDPRIQRQLDKWKDALARDPWVDETTRILSDMKKAQ